MIIDYIGSEYLTVAVFLSELKQNRLIIITMFRLALRLMAYHPWPATSYILYNETEPQAD